MSLSIPFSFHKYIPIYLFINSSRSINNEHKDHKISFPNFNFEKTSYISETDLEENIDELDLPSEMLRLLTMEDKQIMRRRKSRLAHL